MTILTAAIINLLVGLTVFGAVRLAQEHEEPGTPPTPAHTNENSAPSPELPMLWRVLLIVAAGTALSSFIYEIAWVRMLSLVLGSATHSFELMLSAFILGLSLGAFWVRTRADGFRDPVRALGVTQWAMGALAILTLSAYLMSFDWMAFLIQGLDQNAEGYALFTVAKYGIALAVMLPATFCAGITLPLITRMLLNAGSGERAVGIVYSVNTLGSIIGAGLAALVLMPLLGLKTLLVSGGVIDMGLGVWLMFIAGRTSADTRKLYGARGRDGARRRGGRHECALRPQHHHERRVSLRARPARRWARHRVLQGRAQTATVSVSKAEDGGYLVIDERQARRFPLAHVVRADHRHDDARRPRWRRVHANPPAAHHARACTRCQTGRRDRERIQMSSHLLLGSPTLEKLVTIDIEPEMINGSHTFYPGLNRRVFDDPRSQYVHDDAKSYFAASNRKF